MKITNKFLKEKSACVEGFKWVNEQGIVGQEHTEFIKYLLAHDHFDYANWLITQILKKDGLVRYAIFAAEQVLDIFEKKYTGDNRPRKAIEAAKEYLKTHSKSAADAAYAAAYAARAAANAAANAAYAAARAAANAAYAAAYAAADAADAAAYAANAAYAAADAAAELKTKIINSGMQLIGEGI